MRKTWILLAGVAFFLGAPVSTGAVAEDTSAGATLLLPLAQAVQVHRGLTEDAGGPEPATRTESRGVTVIRGPAIDHQPPPSDRDRSARVQRLRISAGEDVWFYDPEDETVSVCRLQKTFKVSAYRIRCFQRRLQF